MILDSFWPENPRVDGCGCGCLGNNPGVTHAIPYLQLPLQYTDHKTLLNFHTQKEMSSQQVHWILNHKNPSKSPLSMIAMLVDTHVLVVSKTKISIDEKIVLKMREAYCLDPWCKKLISTSKGMPDLNKRDGLWFIRQWLIVPAGCGALEQIFALAHNTPGHFGFFKLYENIWNSYFWLGMKKDLEERYIPSCRECMHNKGSMTSQLDPYIHSLLWFYLVLTEHFSFLSSSTHN